MPSSSTSYELPQVRAFNSVCKSGPLLISSKGLGWKSWKRRWFVLTEFSLVFYKSDPANETILPLGGIELNNSGTVLTKADKKLLTVLFPDGRAFTLKTESAEDFEEWKSSLEMAISAAPAADVVMGYSGTFKTASIDPSDGATNLGRSKMPVKSIVVGKPILLALEDIEGSPSFLEKALCFVEQYGVHVEGILRQSADVDEVEKRVFEYEKGKTEFGPFEDAHVIGDCIKHFLRELQSLPVPTPCCAALLEAQGIKHRKSRILAMRTAVTETFPEPNRRLLQRILKMMRTVVGHSAENRMTASAVAACMAPLLLRPLMTGECSIENDSDISGDCSAQLLAAAAAANIAQAIITILLEEYDDIFEDKNLPNVQLSIDASAQTDELASDASSLGEKLQTHGEDADDIDCRDPERVLSGSKSGNSINKGGDIYDNDGVVVDEDFGKETYEKDKKHGIYPNTASTRLVEFKSSWESHEGLMENKSSASTVGVDYLQWGKFSSQDTPKAMDKIVSAIPNNNVNVPSLVSCRSSASINSSQTGSTLGASSDRRSSASKGSPIHPSLNLESSGDEKLLIQRLEATRNELRRKIEKEAKGNAALQQSLLRRKRALHERRLVLEQDVARLREQLQAERNLRAAAGIGLSMYTSQSPSIGNLDSKAQTEIEEIAAAEADVARLKQRVAELHAQLRQQHGKHDNDLERQEMNQQERSRPDRKLNMEIEIRSEQTSALERPVVVQWTRLQESKVTAKLEKERNSSSCKQSTKRDLIVKSDRKILRMPLPSAADRKQQTTGRHRYEPSSSTSLMEGQAMSQTSETITVCTGIQSLSENLGNGKTSTWSVHERKAAASSALAELTTRLNFFKERRSLMVQLQNLDSTHSESYGCHGFTPLATPP